MDTPKPKPYWSPYAAGFFLGLVLLAGFLLNGEGLGASGGLGRIILFFTDRLAPGHVDTLPHAAPILHGEHHILKDPLVFMVLGVALGGLLGALSAGRFVRGGTVERGPHAGRGLRLALALVGGILMGVGARLGRGCTSGQALSGGALLSLGSWIFMLAVFAGGFAAARLVRREWR